MVVRVLVAGDLAGKFYWSGACCLCRSVIEWESLDAESVSEKFTRCKCPCCEKGYAISKISDGYQTSLVVKYV